MPHKTFPISTICQFLNKTTTVSIILTIYTGCQKTGSLSYKSVTTLCTAASRSVNQFSNSFAITLRSKSLAKLSPKIPSHFGHVATVPCETSSTAMTNSCQFLGRHVLTVVNILGPPCTNNYGSQTAAMQVLHKSFKCKQKKQKQSTKLKL